MIIARINARNDAQSQTASEKTQVAVNVSDTGVFIAAKKSDVVNGSSRTICALAITDLLQADILILAKNLAAPKGSCSAVQGPLAESIGAKELGS